MGEKPNRRWTYEEHPQDASHTYVIRAGDKIIGQVGSRGDADLICRSRRAAMQQSMHSTFEARQHRLRTQSMREHIRLLLSTRTSVAYALKETTRRRDVLTAREHARRILRKMKAHGFSP